MTAINIEKTSGDLVGVVRSKAGQGWDKISELAETQSKMLANQGAWITESRINGALKNDDELYKLFVDQLEDSVESLARSIGELAVLTVEEAWNAIVGVLWGAINTALKGAGLGLLQIPSAPA